MINLEYVMYFLGVVTTGIGLYNSNHHFVIIGLSSYIIGLLYNLQEKMKNDNNIT